MTDDIIRHGSVWLYRELVVKWLLTVETDVKVTHSREEAHALRKSPLSRKAARALYDAYYPATYRKLLAIAQDEHLAQEVTQEAFVRAFERFEQLHSDTKFGAWVFQIGVNYLRDRWRKGQREQPADQQTFYPLISQEAAVRVEEVVVEQERTESLIEAFESLSREQRELVVLYYVEEYSVAEIASVLQIPEGTVKSRLYRVRQVLREFMERS
jgi:RNA polymerase sigma-70 factor (ECF subfamily)